MRVLIIIGILSAAVQGMALTVEVGASGSPIPRARVLEPAVQLPRQGVIVAKFHDGRFVARGTDPLTGLPTEPLIFRVIALDRFLLQSLTQQVAYTLRSNDRRGKGNGSYPLVMELEHAGHRRWIVVRHLPHEKIAWENQGKLNKGLKWLDI